MAAACHSGSSRAFELGSDAARNAEWDAAVRYYERALAESPSKIEYRIAFERAVLEASRAHLREARSRAARGDTDGAIERFETALDYDPTNRYARDELEELRAQPARSLSLPPASRVTAFREGEPRVDPSSSDLLRVKFPDGSSLRTVLEALAELAGINVVFDESFRDQRVAVDLEGVSYREILDILMQTNGLFYKVVGSSAVIGR